MISEQDLLQVLKLLSDNLYKIVEIDLNNDRFYEIRIAAQEKTERKDMYTWIQKFAKKNVHPADIQHFLAFFNIEDTKDCLRDNWMRRLYYRRKVGTIYRWVCVEVVKTENYDEENNALVLLSVRDVEDYIRDFQKQEAILNENDI